MSEINNAADIIDSRDVIARIEELQDERQALADELEEAEADGDNPEAVATARAALAEWDDSEEGDELKALLALQEEAEGYADDWRHGAQLIRESYIEEHARDLAEDIHGKAVRDAEWPFCHIDWADAAEALMQDYTCVDFQGVNYWVR